MIQVTSREFRDKQAALFKLADKGEKVVIRRRGKASYMLTPVSDSDFVITPELEKRLEEGRKEYRESKTISFKTKEELHSFLESL
jgi:antitoxin (DNA-binding transcriptional repressor) of toxin-antitoxin stability system